MIEFIYSNISLYNQEELLGELNIKEIFSDEDIFLEAYKRWGTASLDKLNGDFAIALLDTENDRIIAARDSIGIRSLYYTSLQGHHYFSDDIDKLLGLPKSEKIPNLHSINTLLHQEFVDYEETMYEGIKRIPPGHYLVISGTKAELFRYWYPEKIEINYAISLGDAALKFLHLFEEAILTRVGNEDETAFELSGGLDSSSIVSTFKTKYPSCSIDTYSMQFGDLNCDETHYIHSVEQKYHFTSKKLDAVTIDYKNKFDWEFNYKMSPHWPIATTFAIHFPFIEMMQRDKKKIVITGQGGDHLLTGNCFVLADLAKRFEFWKIFKELKHLYPSPIRFSPSCLILPLLSQKQKNILKSILLPILRKKSAPSYQAPRDLFLLKDILSFPGRDDLTLLIGAAVATSNDSDVLHVLEKVYGVEFRHPFFDKKLIEFLLSLPPEYKYSRGWTKLLLRYSMENILPEMIRGRKSKAEFSETIIQQLQSSDIREQMKNSHLVSLGLIAQKEIDRAIDLFENSNTEELSYLWKIVNIEIWYQKNFIEI